MLKELLIKLIGALFIFCLLCSTPALAGVAQYTYDNLNRLVQVQYDDGTTVQYAYDAVGNRLVQQVTAFSQLSFPTGELFSPTGHGAQIPADASTLQNFPAPAGSK
jgi:YD repeat-containing protein